MKREAIAHEAVAIRPRYPEQGFVETGMQAGTPHPENRMRSRVRYAGLLWKVVCEFEALPEVKPGALHLH